MLHVIVDSLGLVLGELWSPEAENGVILIRLFCSVQSFKFTPATILTILRTLF